jgi:hypothetical protein
MPKFVCTLVIALCLLGPSVARAGFVLTFDNDTLQGRPGDTLTFIATLVNESATETLTLDSGGVSSLETGLTQHPGDTLFDDNFLIASNVSPLAPNGTPGDRINAAIISIDIDLGATAGTTLLGTFDVSGHHGSDPPDSLAPTGPTFHVEVLQAANVPEPGSLALIAGILGPGAALLYRRRQRGFCNQRAPIRE